VNDDEIRARLRAMGAEPIDDQTRATHMRRMAAGGSLAEPRRRGFVWAGIAAAAVVGFLAGSTGLAMADALPDPAQEVAHDVLRVVQVDVPQGKEGKRGPCMSQAAKIKDKDAKKAAKDACPKGGGDESGDETGDGAGTPEQGPPSASDPCHGRPPWAGPMSKEQRDAAKASASRANCPKDAEDADESQDESADESDDESAAAVDAATTTESTVSTTSTTAPTEPAAPTVSQPAQP
jgi:hypothetical protein